MTPSDHLILHQPGEAARQLVLLFHGVGASPEGLRRWARRWPGPTAGWWRCARRLRPTWAADGSGFRCAVFTRPTAPIASRR